MPEKRKRIYMLDEIRGFAIISMIVHHTFLDIGGVLGLEWGYRAFDTLCVLQPFFWSAFIIISGMCTRLSRSPVKRGALVLVCAAAVTLVTAVIMPLMGIEGAEIYFGILHCLGICMIVTGLLMPLIRRIDYRVGAAVSLALFLLLYGVDSGYMAGGLIRLPQDLYQYDFLAPLGLHGNGFFSADYFPLIPWIFMFFFGAFIGKLAGEDALPAAMYKKRSRFLAFTGKNSLWVYLAHQPVIYAILFIIGLIIL